jgi:hypothetical protein
MIHVYTIAKKQRMLYSIHIAYLLCIKRPKVNDMPVAQRLLQR